MQQPHASEHLLTREECIEIEALCTRVGQVVTGYIPGGRELPNELSQSLQALRRQLATDPLPPINARDIELSMVYPFLEYFRPHSFLINLNRNQNNEPHQRDNRLIAQDAQDLFRDLTTLSDALITRSFRTHQEFFTARFHRLLQTPQNPEPTNSEPSNSEPSNRANDSPSKNNRPPKGPGQ